MFWTLLGEVLSPGLGAALSPMMIVAATILASLQGGSRKAFIFATGDFLALGALGILAVLAADSARNTTASAPSPAVAAVRLALGLSLWFLAWRTFQRRPGKGEAPGAMEKLNALDQLTTARLFLAGLTLGLLNAKNLPLTISAAATVSQVGAGSALNIIAMLIFAGLGTIAVLLPGVVALLAPQDSERLLGPARNFFVTHNTAIMIVLFVVLGANAIGKSLGPLLG